MMEATGSPPVCHWLPFLPTFTVWAALDNAKPGNETQIRLVAALRSR